MGLLEELAKLDCTSGGMSEVEHMHVRKEKIKNFAHARRAFNKKWSVKTDGEKIAFDILKWEEEYEALLKKHGYGWQIKTEKVR
jgi:hypothetical protein